MQVTYSHVKRSLLPQLNLKEMCLFCQQTVLTMPSPFGQLIHQYIQGHQKVFQDFQQISHHLRQIWHSKCESHVKCLYLPQLNLKEICLFCQQIVLTLDYAQPLSSFR